MNQKQKITITIVISLIVLSLFAYRLLSLYLSSDALSPTAERAPEKKVSAEQSQTATEIPNEEPVFIRTVVPKDYSKDELNSMYEMSRRYNNCQADIFELEATLTSVKVRFDSELSKIEDPKQWALAKMHMHSLGVISAQNAVSSIEANEVNRFRRTFEYHSGLNEPSSIQKKQLASIQTLSLALRDKNYSSLPTIIRAFNAISEKQGLSTEVRKERVLLMPDTVIGNALTVLDSTDVSRLLNNVTVNDQMLVQAIRSGADAALVQKLLGRMNFVNKAVFTKEGKRETAIQAAIRENNIEVLRILVDQPNLRFVQFSFSPVNTILMEVLQTDGASGLNTSQTEMMQLLHDYNYTAQVWKNERYEQLELLGYPFAVLTPELSEQLSQIDMKPQLFKQLSSAQPQDFDPDVKAIFDNKSGGLKQSQARLAKTKLACDPLEEEWKAQLPPINQVADIRPYLNRNLSFEEQVKNLANISPVLVDKFYLHSLGSNSDTDDIDDLVDDISDIRADFAQLKEALADVDMDLSRRQFLVEKLCEEFDTTGVYASFQLARFIDYNNADIRGCLFELQDYFTSIRDDFFAHPDTFPSEVVFELNNDAVAAAITLIENSRSATELKLNGFPQGRDALMLALDMKNNNSLGAQFDYEGLLNALLERTELTNDHLQRMHRLKVVDILMFERLRARFPRLLDASKQPFNIY